jgi:hypothetical protein
MAVLVAPEASNQLGAMTGVGYGPALLSMEANGGLGSTAVDFTVKREWLGRVESRRSFGSGRRSR